MTLARAAGFKFLPALPGVNPYDERRQYEQRAYQGEGDVDHGHNAEVNQDWKIPGDQQCSKAADDGEAGGHDGAADLGHGRYHSYKWLLAVAALFIVTHHEQDSEFYPYADDEGAECGGRWSVLDT